MKLLKTEVLVIGSGGAGMYASISAAHSGKDVILADKSLISRGGATVMAQMTVAAAVGHEEADHWTHHLADTIKSGQGLCNEELSSILCEEAVDRILEMGKWKTDWARKDSRMAQVMAPGHSVKRCCYVDFLNTGPAISRTLRGVVAKQPNIKRVSGLTIIDLIVERGIVKGAIGLETETGTYIAISTNAVVLAAGGLTRIFSRNSASLNMGGDACALALRAGADLIDMEFVQFFPIGHLAPRLVGMDPIMWDPFRYKLGGRLLNGNQEQFIETYGGADGKAYTVGRDLASYAIIKEVEAGRGSPNGGAWLSFQHIPKVELENAFGPIIEKLADNNIDLTKDAIEVSPIAHYHMGGIKVNAKMETRIHGLFAAGEAVGGANGANRLSGNAIPEAFVFGERAGRFAAGYTTQKANLTTADAVSALAEVITKHQTKNIVGNNDEALRATAIMKQLQNTMWEDVGVIRTQKSLSRALVSIRNLRDHSFSKISPPDDTVYNKKLMDWLDLRNSLLCAEAVCLAACNRKESRGAHQMEDIPDAIDEFEKNQVIELNDGILLSSWEDVKRISFKFEQMRMAVR
jgi:succinate dehydrogenase / fumarate reductase flavoprotein subunit/fumarate reductase (CoM/CoB) subunit A